MTTEYQKSMKTRRRSLWFSGSILAILLLILLYEFVVGSYHLFPYDQYRAISFRARIKRAEKDAEKKGRVRLQGRWHKARETSPQDSLDMETREQLASLGYLGGYTIAGHVSGTTLYDSTSVAEGFTLYCSGQAPVVYLISLSGDIVHKWETTFDRVWPHEICVSVQNREHKHFLRRAHVFPNGDLLAIFEYVGIFKLDRDSKLLWKRPNRSHHDFIVTHDGSIISLVRQYLTSNEVSKRYPGFKCPENGICDDLIAILDPSGNETERISLFEAFYWSDYAPFLATRQESRDVFHANSVQLIGDRHGEPIITNGEILVSLRDMSAVVSVDVEEKRISWMLTGKWEKQHQAYILDTGNILLLDNLGGNRHAPLQFDQSQVLEVNPISQEIEWRYVGSDNSPFFTHWLGYVQRLENDNTLITESTEGRIFEVTPEGRIVWEYLNPYRAGENGKLIATVMGAQRINPEDVPFLED